MTIKELFSSGQYVIPVYQRNYAWTQREITQLIQDIADYASQFPDQVYYIGTLVVYERQTATGIVFETIDGQQRLTTLNILLSVIRNNPDTSINSWYKMNLKFDSRPAATNTLGHLYNDPKNIHRFSEINTEIYQGYSNAGKSLATIVNETLKGDQNKFIDYLINQVCIMRVSVPQDTDLNHYFEILNNRGEQLEKHEILKADCLKALKNDPELERTFNKIWEACANMDRYVQYGFSVDERNAIFGSEKWDDLKYDNFENIVKALEQASEKTTKKENKNLFLSTIITQPMPSGGTDEEDDLPGRFTPVINFSNFLLHVLRIQTGEDIPLDDKRLLPLFYKHIKPASSRTALIFVKQFGYNLLKCKFLFDKYIIKRERLNDSDGWSLKKLKWYNKKTVSYINTFDKEDQERENGDGQKILMLLAMFHVSNPTLVYKHWLNGALKYLFEQEGGIVAKDYREYLTQLADAFLYDRFLTDNPIDYYTIIYQNKGVSNNEDINEDLLNKGTDVENFIFNYLDYLLWRKNKRGHEKFTFTFRSSVEHYYPQHPFDGFPELDPEYLDHFGNLCLIQSNQNSRLSNFSPEAKKDHYLKTKSIESMKQQIMLDTSHWGVKEIVKHGKDMRDILLSVS